MTAQRHDQLRWGTETGYQCWLSLLPVGGKHPRVVHGEDPTHVNTACWRGYVAFWAIVDQQLVLEKIEGRFRVVGEPIPADWVSGLFIAGVGGYHSYTHMGFLSTFSSVVEFQIVAGRVTRSRQLDAPVSKHEAEAFRGFNGRTPNWEVLPSWTQLFDTGCASKYAPEEPRMPLLRHVEGEALRARVRTVRQRLRLRLGDLAMRAGMAPHCGGRIAEYERGERELNESQLNAVCDSLAIGASDRAAMRAMDVAKHQAALVEWQSTPMRPTLTVQSYATYRYFVPASLGHDLEAMIRWAQRCSAVAWRRVVLTGPYHGRTHIDAFGAVQSPLDHWVQLEGDRRP